MSKHYDRRQILKRFAAAGASLFFRQRGEGQDRPGRNLVIAGQDVEVQIASVSAYTLRLTILPIKSGQPIAVPHNGSLVDQSFGTPIFKSRQQEQSQTVQCGNLRVKLSAPPWSFTIENQRGDAVQHLTVEEKTGILSFNTGDAPLLGLGEGGPQFDRRGSIDSMRSGQGGYQLATHGGRVPVPC